MNTRTWGIVLIALCLFDFGMGALNLYSFAVDPTQTLSLVVGIVVIAVGFYILRMVMYSWYPSYKMENIHKTKI